MALITLLIGNAVMDHFGVPPFPWWAFALLCGYAVVCDAPWE